MEFKIGIYDNISYEDYASIPAYRASDLKEVIKCPFSWRNRRPRTTHCFFRTS